MRPRSDTPRDTLRLWPALCGAARAFGGWWLPLCLVAGSLLFTQRHLPGKLLGDDIRVLEAYEEIWHSARRGSGSSQALAETLFRLGERLSQIAADQATYEASLRLCAKTIAVVGGVLVIVCLLHTVLIILSRASVQTRREDRHIRRNLRRSAVLGVSYIVLTVIKMVPFVFGAAAGVLLFIVSDSNRLFPVLCMLPALYLYLRLFFTGFIITEGAANPFAALHRSWHMTAGHFFSLALLLAVELGINAFSILTVVGFIPGTSFKYTLRAAVYRQLRMLETGAGPGPGPADLGKGGR